MEISEEMQEALAILRSDKRIEAYNKMTESHQALVARLDKRDADDETWRKELAERIASGAGEEKEGSGEASVENPTGDDKGTGKEGGAPPPPAVKTEEEIKDEKPKKRSRWWGDLED